MLINVHNINIYATRKMAVLVYEMILATGICKLYKQNSLCYKYTLALLCICLYKFVNTTNRDTYT